MAKGKLLISFIALVSLHFATAEEIKSSNDRPNRKRSVTDPVSNFFSELGDLFLDIDGTIAVKTSPKVEFERSLESQVLGPLQPRKEHFDRIQENYKTLQGRLGSIIADAISPQQNVQRRKMDRSPFGKSGTGEVPNDEDRWNSRHAAKRSQGRRFNIFNVDQIEVVTMGNIPSNTRKTGDLLSTLGKPSSEMSSDSIRRRGDLVQSEESDPQERIIGDVLYSESRFDRYIRQLLRDHGKWVLDNPLLKRWRGSSRQHPNQETEETSAFPFSETTAKSITTSTTDLNADAQPTESMKATTESENKMRMLEQSFEKRSPPLPIMAANYYRVDGKPINEEVDIIFESDPETANEMEAEAVEEEAEAAEEAVQEIESEVEEELEPLDTVILAFTPDGVPLKLRFGPEIQNPVKYLHRVLRLAGVTLKIPVESHDDLEPVGKEVMLLGSSTGIITRAVYLNMSNPDELKSLLRTLMRSKETEIY